MKRNFIARQKVQVNQPQVAWSENETRDHKTVRPGKQSADLSRPITGGVSDDHAGGEAQGGWKSLCFVKQVFPEVWCSCNSQLSRVRIRVCTMKTRVWSLGVEQDYR